MSQEDSSKLPITSNCSKSKPTNKCKKSKKHIDSRQPEPKKENSIVPKTSQKEFIQQKQKFKDIGHLASIAEEYLSSFALIGYSLQDEKVVVLNMPTSKDEAALVDLIRATFVDLANNRP